MTIFTIFPREKFQWLNALMKLVTIRPMIDMIETSLQALN
jgi:hypothetical protein